MCLIYNHLETQQRKAEGKPLVLYKMYHVQKRPRFGEKESATLPLLYSPFFSFMGSGEITGPGEKNSDNTGQFARRDSEGRFLDYSMDKLLSSDNTEIDIPGFHCFVSKEDAQWYGASTFDIGRFCIVKVTTTSDSIIAAGSTPWRGRKLPTLVVSRINISEEEFQKAVA